MQRREFLIKSGIAAATVSFAGGTLASELPQRSFSHERSEKADPVLKLKGLSIGVAAPKIIASITGGTADEVMDQALAIGAAEQVDIAEFRLDYLPATMSPATVTQLANRVGSSLKGKPLLTTFRSQEEGGERGLSDEEYFGLYAALLQSPAVDLIDIEMLRAEIEVRKIIAAAHVKGVAVVLSNHDFESTPAHHVILERLRRQQALGGDILKIAAMPQSPADVLTMMAATQEMHASDAQRPLLTMSMGPMGVISRIAGQLSGSALTYASVGSASAPGQLDASAVHTVLGIIDKGSSA